MKCGLESCCIYRNTVQRSMPAPVHSKPLKCSDRTFCRMSTMPVRMLGTNWRSWLKPEKSLNSKKNFLLQFLSLLHQYKTNCNTVCVHSLMIWWPFQSLDCQENEAGPVPGVAAVLPWLWTGRELDAVSRSLPVRWPSGRRQCRITDQETRGLW